ncbi:MAG: hypothetical protein ABR545_03895, partial [Cyclonatronaceae bacterium]
MALFTRVFHHFRGIASHDVLRLRPFATAWPAGCSKRAALSMTLVTSTSTSTTTEIKYLDVIDLGLVPYQQAWDLQKAVQKRLIDEKKTWRTDPSAKRSNDVLLFVEHPHVFTLGKSGDGSHLLAAAGVLDRIGATYVKIDRG